MSPKRFQIETPEGRFFTIRAQEPSAHLRAKRIGYKRISERVTQVWERKAGRADSRARVFTVTELV